MEDSKVQGMPRWTEIHSFTPGIGGVSWSATIGNWLRVTRNVKKAHWVASAPRVHQSYPEMRDKCLETSLLKEVNS
ncbi:hypothetical protein E2C01_033737 [Portunus trituberculatus]|uniref:Uncharacterized protein n=1 Tax=Portunus trituberculatus TaxID=210409 RepID=A0A5B7EYP1_PORTR|nr:hypothetical protein [Portunus trituberculatus]